MKTAGIIAEYNPFHNGHAYHIEETRIKTGADYIIAVMSGNFVQRGAPAIINKYARARMALENGADLVLELPVCAAVSSAEAFALGGVSLLAGLGVVSSISFGSELKSPMDFFALDRIAGVLVKEPNEFRQILTDRLKQGISFPAARAEAINEYLKREHPSENYFSNVMKRPNNILAIEYLKALKTYEYNIEPCMVTRAGGGYHEAVITGSLSSATAIRKQLHENSIQTALPEIQESVPSSVFSQLASYRKQFPFVRENHFSELLHYALLNHADELEKFTSGNDEFANRVRNELEHFQSWTQFATLLKTKNLTYTYVSRFLLHVLLNMNCEHEKIASDCNYAPYARILGFRKNAAPLLKAISEKCTIPYINRLSQDERTLDPSSSALLDLDIRATDIYNLKLSDSTGTLPQNEYRHPLIYVSSAAK